MSGVADYQAALREHARASAAWRTLHRRLGATAKLSEAGDPIAFMLDPQPETGTEPSSCYRAVEWPTAARIEEMAKQITQAEKAVWEAWEALPADDRIGLAVPTVARR